MNWPGMGDPAKRKKTLRFLAITGGIAIAVAVASTFVQMELGKNDPLKVCINNRETHYKISASLELFVDGKKVQIPANMGNTEQCKRALYTVSDDGIIHAEWDEEYPFEIGHFLWVAEFKLRDMDQSQSKIYVNDVLSDDFIHAPLKDGYHYKAIFVSKEYDESKGKDFQPPE